MNAVTTSYLPLYACLAALAAVPLIAVSRRWPNLREAWTLLAAVTQYILVLFMLPPVLEGKILACTLREIVPGVPIAFRVDALGALFALVASGLWILISIYSIGYMRALKEHAQTRFFEFFALSLAATLGVAFAGNLLTLYVFYECLSLATYPLVTHHQDASGRSGGRTYLSYLLGSSILFVLPAMLYCAVQTGGNLDFSADGFLEGFLPMHAALPVLLLLVFGFAKNGLMPLHSWLPGAMVAPTPVSALLHAVAVVKVGVFCVMRVVLNVFGTDFLGELELGQVLSWIAAFTVITASLVAMSQDNLKRRLAFSTIGQLSYIILGVSLLSSAGIAGSMMHIAAHALGKITLFACAGAIFVTTGKKYASELNGIGHQMPLTMLAFSVGALSVTGLPPTAGFVSKIYLLYGTLQAGQPALMAIFLISTILNAYYLLTPVYRAFFIPPQHSRASTQFNEAPACCLVPILATAGMTLVLFFKPDLLMYLAEAMLDTL